MKDSSQVCRLPDLDRNVEAEHGEHADLATQSHEPRVVADLHVLARLEVDDLRVVRIY